MENQKQISEQSHIEFGLDVLKLESLIQSSQPEMSGNFAQCYHNQFLPITENISNILSSRLLKCFVNATPSALKDLCKDINEAKNYFEGFFDKYSTSTYNQNTNDSASNNYLAFLLNIPIKNNFVFDAVDIYIRTYPAWYDDYNLGNHELAKLVLEMYIQLKIASRKVEQVKQAFAELTTQANKLAINFYQKFPKADEQRGLEKRVKEFFYDEWNFPAKTDSIMRHNAPQFEVDHMENKLVANSKKYLYTDVGLDKIKSERSKLYWHIGAVFVIVEVDIAFLLHIFKIPGQPFTNYIVGPLSGFILTKCFQSELNQISSYFESRKKYVRRVAMLHLLLSPYKDMNQHQAYQLIQSIKPPAKPQA